MKFRVPVIEGAHFDFEESGVRYTYSCFKVRDGKWRAGLRREEDGAPVVEIVSVFPPTGALARCSLQHWVVIDGCTIMLPANAFDGDVCYRDVDSRLAALLQAAARDLASALERRNALFAAQAAVNMDELLAFMDRPKETREAPCAVARGGGL